ncbi:MAG: hypothetical protein F6K25_03980 [Okeania sp. SIO2G4]|uniref:hypothetical protein n=1 Tax=unclassified Okeania TaxID=2634635 RepID=UPI0013B850F2|nr:MULTISPECIES: hypothetical protein [unclassified Okeania]NEP70887.1 hypothetical protein [Okeania sp. SIO2G5]NEP92333.1 hypothetical protein [Okeania sp. SIO2F5]NEQ89939.1 hypothetical protein [Okeania sp. SIO2G4]
MAEVDDRFNLRDWEWIAVHFPPSERESMAKVAWLICCKCTPKQISQYNPDPRIVIPLCAIVLFDEIDEINEINPSERWQSLFETLDRDLQFVLLSILIKYRPPIRDNWYNLFLDVKLEFLLVFYLPLITIFIVTIFIVSFDFPLGVNFLVQLIILLILQIYTTNIGQKMTNPLKNILKSDSFANLIFETAEITPMKIFLYLTLYDSVKDFFWQFCKKIGNLSRRLITDN